MQAAFRGLIAPTAAGAALALAACGATDAKTAPTETAKTPASGQTARPFRSPTLYGYRFARPPIVNLAGDTFELYFRMNTLLPKKPGRYTLADSTVDHVFGGFSLAKATYTGDPKPCYHQELDISRYADHEPEEVKVGELVTVRLYIAKHKTPLRVRVPLSRRVADSTGDLAEPYLRRLGCPRS